MIVSVSAIQASYQRPKEQSNPHPYGAHTVEGAMLFRPTLGSLCVLRVLCGSIFRHIDQRKRDEHQPSRLIFASLITRRHARAMLGNGKRPAFRKPQVVEVVTICDHLGFLGGTELKDEVLLH